ncbi:MAG: Abi family protein [Prevotella copri]|nr:Abi family protein [Segatella copri]
MMLYRFDKKLRLLMFNEIEKIEIAIRRAVMQITADMTGNPFWLTDSSYFLDSSRFNETMRAISKEYSKSRRSSFSISNEPTQSLTHHRREHFRWL